MEIQEIKKQMLEYTDFYGGDFDKSSIIKAKSKEELKEIIDRHEELMNDSLTDAISNLERFKEEIGLNLI